MSLHSIFLSRLKTVMDKTKSIEHIPQQAKMEIEHRLKLIESLLATYLPSLSSHPLGDAPFLSARIMFELDRCECLLEYNEPLKVEEPLLPFRFWVTVLRRTITFLLYARGRLLGYYAFYDTPMLIEILYLKSNAWNVPIIYRLLPKKRL